MKTKTQTKPSIENLKYLPAYAQYILKHRLEELTAYQMQIAEELEIPIMQFFKEMPDEQRFEITKNSAAEFLTYLAQNKAKQQIEFSLKQWKENMLPNIHKEDIVAEDITLLTYLRKKSLMHFIADYTSAVDDILEIIEEIDLFLITSQTASTNTFINLLKEKISGDEMVLRENEYRYKRAEAITHLGSYRWNLKTNELVWSDELHRIYGLEPGKDSTDFEYVSSFNDAEDTPVIRAAYSIAIQEKKPFDFHYNITAKNGTRKIIHARGEIITNENNEAVEVIGTAQDVTEKQMLIQKLRRTESVYRQAEELVKMGNWTWDLKNHKLEWTDHLYIIYGLLPQSEEITIDRFLSFIHPGDREYVKNGVNEIFKNDLVDYTFRIITASGKTKYLRSIATVRRDEKGNAVYVVGTERDITEKQTLIDKLTSSEKLYKQAQALAHLGNWSWDVKNNVVEWSDELYRIYGLEPQSEQLTYEKYLSFVHPDNREKVKQQIEHSLQTHESYELTHKLIRKNGEVRIIRATGEVLTDANNQPISFFGTVQDITEQQQLIDRLQESEKQFKQAQSLARLGNWSMDVKTKKITWSEEMFNIYEEDHEKPLNFEDWIHYLTGEEKDAALAYFENSLMQKKGYDRIHTIRIKNGTVKTVHHKAEFILNEQGKPVKIAGTTQDITEEHQKQEKIKEQEYFIQQLADASPTILYLFDVQQQKIVYINREIFFVLGYLPDQIINWEDAVTEKIYHPEDFHLLPARKQSTRNFQQADSMIQYECRLKNNEGAWRWLLVREIVFKTDKDGNVLQILGAALDINRRKEMERTILQNAMLLEQSNASLEEFAYVASHDLKEPLRKISTFGDRLAASQQNNLSDEGKMYLNKITDASQRMQTMISDLLSISMISNNASFEKYSLQKILDEVLQTLEFKIEQQNAIVKSDALPEADIIPSQFRQLFQNLLSNSLKFVKPGVQPVITIKYSLISSENNSHFQSAHAAQYHKLEFSDNGIGLENEFAGKIFAIFQRLHGRSEYEGSGIGLAICKKIAEHHGGVIYANGLPGVGATFTIMLPA